MNEYFEKLSVFLKSIGSLRDGILVCGGLIYFCGYFVWSLVAWQHNLGQMPIFDSQYFVAGIPVLISFIILFYLLGRMKHFLIEDWPAWIARKRPITRNSIYALLFLFTALIGFSIAVGKFFPQHFSKYNFLYVIYILVGALSGFLLIFF
jgi:hypothetical protein